MKNKNRLFMLALSAAVAGTILPGIISGVNVMAEEIASAVIVNEDFENGAGEWYAAAGSDQTQLNIIENASVDGSSCVLISGRTESWNCIVKRIEGLVENGATYKISCSVKLDPESYEEGTEKWVNFGSTHQDSTMANEDYDKFAFENAGVMANTTEWKQIEGTVIPTFSGKLTKFELKVCEGSSTGNYFVDNIVVEKIADGVPAEETAPIEIQKDIPSLKNILAEEESIGGKSGVAIPVNALGDEARMELVLKHFNSITPENEMKPDAILGGSPEIDEEGNLILHFENADKIMDYVKAYNEANPEDTIGVHGHVLVWHSQTPEWFYHEEYDVTKPYVSKEVMLERLEKYIDEVITHFETAYPGIIYEWDVVNEQIEPSDFDDSVNPYALRKQLNGEDTSYYKIFQGSDEYIIHAFKSAKATLEKLNNDTIRLMYNDYGDADPTKCQYICDLLQRIKDAGGTVDGMGMQAHYAMDRETTEQIEATIRNYCSVVGRVSFTEFDMQSSSSYDGSDQSMEYTKMGYRYKEIYDLVKRLDQEEGIDISGWTFWGSHDTASWLHTTSAVGGGADGKRQQCPLLFDGSMQAKPTYWAIVDPSQLEPFIHTENANYSAELSTEHAALMEFKGAQDNTCIAKAVWSEEGLKVQVEIPSVTDEAAAVHIYVSEDATSEEPGKSFTIAKEEWIETENGYIAEYLIPVSEFANALTVNTSIRFDVQLTDGEQTYSWNDLRNTQAETGKYYGILILKPFTVIEKGTIQVDGEADELWESVAALPLSIRTGAATNTASVKTLWDEENLYVYYEVEDAEVSVTNANAWEQDSVEIFLDQNNTKTESYEEDDCQYRISAENVQSFNGVNCTEENIVSAVKATDTGYAVEAAIKWTHITPETGTKIGIEFQINDGQTEGERLGTISWYDQTGNGYANPGVFGTAVLEDDTEE